MSLGRSSLVICADVATETKFYISFEVSFYIALKSPVLVLAMLVIREVTVLKPVNEIQADSDGGNKIWPFSDLRGG